MSLCIFEKQSNARSRELSEWSVRLGNQYQTRIISIETCYSSTFENRNRKNSSRNEMIFYLVL